MKLINEKTWEKNISELKSKIKLEKKEFLDELETALINSIKQKMPKEKFGILFSGGVDSTFIAKECKELKGKFICYSVDFEIKGMKPGEDKKWAEEIAKKYGFMHKTIKIGLEKAEKSIRETAKIIGSSDAVKIGVGMVVNEACKQAKKDGIKHLFSGLGSEEIFAGYQRHELAKNKHKECWDGLKMLWERDLSRDLAISKAYKTELILPFLNEEVIEIAMKTDPKYKISKEEKKIILRKIAEKRGLSKKYAWRKKRAAQYGSNADKAIAKISKNSGFKYKRDFLESIWKKTKAKKSK